MNFLFHWVSLKEVIFVGDNMKADDVAGLAGMFGVGFTQKDTNTLQKWIDEEKNHVTEGDEEK